MESLTVEIPQPITYVKLSNSRRKKYYNRKSRIPKKYLSEEYTFNKKGILINRLTKEPVVANPKVAGTPKFKKINGQEIYSGNVHPKVRASMIRQMKLFYKSFFSTTLKVRDACKLRLDIYDLIGKGDFDLDNMSWIIVKVIQDVLVEKKIIPDDNVTVLTGYEVNFISVLSEDERKIVITLLTKEYEN